ncbi:acetyl-CoA acetyltransferase [Rhodovulum imhoffii]|uniref:Acetyl-CoA acetyltransferase n=1 Tax=Rhodovulum imhoffii TaxID=365340 RepID=A0A2T5BNS0_9RHOB|nr:acetyl-CoA C-acetyltransferase [Rhodovulum imhoffii]MBK5933624.1 acetyl-CoA acetyltransferase [Rhodovulum imhoffii]PTN00624.1 acetyl-CoA acetyltransferase [Rhodovulum imhoffii]
MSAGVFIAAAKRSAIGRLNGALANLPAAQIGAQVVAAMLNDAGVDPAAVDDVLIGQVLSGGAGQNPARQTALAAGIPEAVPAMTLNMVCGAGQRSIHLAAQAIKSGDAGLVVAGGQDSMSQAPHFAHLRGGRKMGDAAFKDMMLTDGLWDAFHDVHMGVTVENLAKTYQITREEQDLFALQSQAKAKAAQDAGIFAEEITPVLVETRAGQTSFRVDEHPNPETTPEQLAAMRPVFDPHGSITAGNASGLNDGASAVLVASRAALAQHGLEPMARVASYASAALPPMDMGLGPVLAARKALDKAGWSVADLDVLEINEAFAAQSIAVEREMGWARERVNPNGGAIALGHPLAGSGNRIVVTLIHEMRRQKARKGLAALCIGGGQGVAICLERV